jgi:hypothetical protein
VGGDDQLSRGLTAAVWWIGLEFISFGLSIGMEVGARISVLRSGSVWFFDPRRGGP